MNSRQFIILMIFGSVSLTMIFIAVLGIYYYEPALLGYPPRNTDSLAGKEALEVNPTLEITESRLKKFEKELIEKERLSRQLDSLKKARKQLADSIKSISSITISYKDSVSGIVEKLKESKQNVSKKNDSLANLEQLYEKTLKNLKSTEQLVKDQEEFIIQKEDSVQKANFQLFAKMYENTDPKEVADILQQIDERDAAQILKFMQKKKAGKVIEAMSPDRAAAILLLAN